MREGDARMSGEPVQVGCGDGTGGDVDGGGRPVVDPGLEAAVEDE